MKKLVLVICVIFLPIASFAQNQKHVTNNQDILDMVKAQLSTELIVKQIQTADSVNFNINPQDLIKLKSSGVPEAVIIAMMERVRVGQDSLSVPVVGKDNTEKKDNLYFNENGYGSLIKEAMTSATKPPAAVKIEKPSVKAKSFTFELDECRLSGDVITCDVIVTHNSPGDIYLGYIYASTMVDDKGNELKAVQKSIGSSDANPATLSSGVGVRARLVFEGIKEAPKVVKLLRLSLYTPALIGGRRIAGGGNFKVELRDLPLAR